MFDAAGETEGKTGLVGAAQRRRIGVARHVLMVGGVILFAVLVYLGASVLIARQRDAAVAAALLRVDLEADSLAARVSGNIEAIDAMLQMAETVGEMRAAGLLAEAAPLEARFAATLGHSVLGAAQAVIIDADGAVIWSIPSAPGAPSAADRDYFEAFKSGGSTGLFISHPLTGRLTHRRVVVFSRALNSVDGRFSGIAAVAVEQERLIGAAAMPPSMAPGSTLSLVRVSDGTILAREVDGVSVEPREPISPFTSKLLQSLPVGRAELGASQSRSGRAVLRGWHEVGTTGLAAVVTLDEAGQVAGAAADARDIRVIAGALVLAAAGLTIFGRLAGARRRAQEALDTSEAARSVVEAARSELERLVSALPVVVYHGEIGTDGVYRRRFMTRNTAAVLGWPLHTMQNQTLLDLLEPVDRAEHDAFYRSLLVEGTDAALEFRLHRPDGSWAWLRDHAHVVGGLPDGGGEVIGCIADVTEERSLRSQAAMATRLATLGELATGLAHELNQPLAVIALASQNALDALAGAVPDLLDVELRLHRIEEQSVRAGEIVQHLRLLARAEAGELAAVGLLFAVQGALALAGGTLREAEVAVEVDIPSQIMVLGRIVAVEQVLLNLALNARDALAALPPGGARQLRFVAASGPGRRVRLEVSDSGVGIPEEMQPRIFEPFFTTKPAGRGMGLGLSICQTIMRSLGGTVALADARAGGGATFVLTFRSAEPAASRPTGVAAVRSPAGSRAG